LTGRAGTEHQPTLRMAAANRLCDAGASGKASDASGREWRERSVRGISPQLGGESPLSNLVEVKD